MSRKLVIGIAAVGAATSPLWLEEAVWACYRLRRAHEQGALRPLVLACKVLTLPEDYTRVMNRLREWAARESWPEENSPESTGNQFFRAFPGMV